MGHESNKDNERSFVQSEQLSLSDDQDEKFLLQADQLESDEERKKTLRAFFIVLAAVGAGIIFWLKWDINITENGKNVYQSESLYFDDGEIVANVSPLPSFDGWSVELSDNELLSSAIDAPRIIYSTIEESTVSLVRKNTKTGQEEVIFTYQAYTRDPGPGSSRLEPIVSGPAIDISRDGKKIAYVDNEGLKVYDLSLGEDEALITIVESEKRGERQIIPPTWSEPELIGVFGLELPLWSADGRYISFIQQNFEGVGNGVIDTKTGIYTKVIGGAYSEYTWSPSENRLAISGTALAAYNPSGLFVSRNQDVAKTENILSGNTGSVTVNFSPDGRQIVTVTGEFVRDQEKDDYVGTKKLLVLNIDGSSAQVINSSRIEGLSLQDPFIAPFFSPNGQSIYFGDEVKGRNVLFRYDLGSQQTVQVGALPDFYKMEQNWTPQGYLVLLGQRSVPGEGQYRVFVLDLNNNKVIYSSGLSEKPLGLVDSE